MQVIAKMKASSTQNTAFVKIALHLGVACFATNANVQTMIASMVGTLIRKRVNVKDAQSTVALLVLMASVASLLKNGLEPSVTSVCGQKTRAITHLSKTRSFARLVLIRAAL
jgi:hypothetical protein